MVNDHLLYIYVHIQEELVEFGWFISRSLFVLRKRETNLLHDLKALI